MSKHKPLINWTPALYDRLSKYYDRIAKWFFPIGDRGRERVLSNLKAGPILDVACGTGTLLEMAQQSGSQCFGIDTSLGMLLVTKQKVPAVDVVQASFYALPFAEDQFETVVETNAVSGVDIDAESVLGEMLRVCTAGGEVRLGDYGKSGGEGFWLHILEKLSILIGDYPYDYEAILRGMGYEAEIENLGWNGLYQYIRVEKLPQLE